MNNGAAIGYAIIAANDIGLDSETIRKLDRAMYEVMDLVSEEEAEEAYRNS